MRRIYCADVSWRDGYARNFRRHARRMRHISHCKTAVNAIISCHSVRERFFNEYIIILYSLCVIIIVQVRRRLERKKNLNKCTFDYNENPILPFY
jgi:hypothetical protein